MSGAILTESTLKPEAAAYRIVVPAGEPWIHELRTGQTLRIVDLEGNQAVDTLFFNLHDPADHYSASDTILAQSNLYLGQGTTLTSVSGNSMATIVADTCGRHDTLGGACSAESNSVRYPSERRHMHNCRDSFTKALRERGDLALQKRDLPPNINFFMNVPFSPDGASTFADGLSAPGKYVELRAEMDLLCLISNCPQLNNPCNAYNPTPIEIFIWN